MGLAGPILFFFFSFNPLSPLSLLSLSLYFFLSFLPFSAQEEGTVGRRHGGVDGGGVGGGDSLAPVACRFGGCGWRLGTGGCSWRLGAGGWRKEEGDGRGVGLVQTGGRAREEQEGSGRGRLGRPWCSRG